MLIEFIIKNQLHYVFLQDILIFLVIYILGDIKKGKRYLLFSLAISFICSLAYGWVNLIATGFVWLFAVFLIFYLTKKINVAILLPSLSILLYILVSYFMGILITAFFSIIDISVELNIAAGSIAYILSAMGIKYIYTSLANKFDITEKMRWSGAILATVTFISYFIIIAIERFAGQETAMGRANSFFIVGYGLISALVFLMLMYSFQKEYAAKEKQKEIFYLNEYTDKLEANYAEMRRFRHDYQNILMSMEDYITAGDLEGLSDYFYTKIKKASQVIEQNNFKLSQLSNVKASEVKSLLASKLTVSQEMGINTEIEVIDQVEEIKADSIILVRSLGIILDNAIEAASTIKDGFVRVAVFKNAGKLIIITANSCTENIPKLFELKQEGFSTKGENRGMGLSNLDRMIAQEKRTMLETKIEQGIFSQILSIGE